MTPPPKKTRSSTTTRPRRELDLVVFGATGFTGSLVARYLAHKAPPGVRIGLAGRSPSKLEKLRRDLGGPAHDWSLMSADSRDEQSLGALAAASRAIVTTVGPYGRYGLPLVAACAAGGTHYADLAGEVLFMRDSIDGYDAAAHASGARIVHSCGFDSIPSDLGVLAMHLAAKADDGTGHLRRTEMVVTHMRGGISGGTLASMFSELDRARADERAGSLFADPFALDPPGTRHQAEDSRDLKGVDFDPILGVWVAPFPMAAINTRVVRRSDALLDQAYGPDFRYRESLATGGGLPGRLGAMAVAAGTLAADTALEFGAARRLATRLLPAPGEGPDERTRQRGSFEVTIHSTTEAAVPYRAVVAGRGDPGYAATAQMLAQTGLTLAGDQRRLPRRYGVLTPASGIGKVLIENLKASGMTIQAHRV